VQQTQARRAVEIYVFRRNHHSGQAEKGGRCPDGTITVARQGDNLALSWFGSVQGTTVVAYGTLSKK
jgi:hypothetical protein